MKNKTNVGEGTENLKEKKQPRNRRKCQTSYLPGKTYCIHEKRTL